jgi:hypothetical protein
MTFLRSLFAASLIAATGLTFSACAQGAGTLPPASLGQISPLAVPPNCKGQQNSKQDATLTAPLQSSGGAFCIPAYGGFGGKLEYPNASFNGTLDLTLTSSVKNYNHQPKLGKGKALFYLQFAISGAVSFGSNLKSGGGLTGATIVSGNPYTLYGQAKVLGQSITLGPCYVTATKGKYGGVIGGLGTLVENREVPAAASGVIEIYSGEQTTYAC